MRNIVHSLCISLLVFGALACESGAETRTRTVATTGASDSSDSSDISGWSSTIGVADTTIISSAAVDSGEVLMPRIRQLVLIEEDSLWADALRIHYNAIVLDGHVDTPTLMLDDGYDFSRRHPAYESHLDLPRMVEGGLDAAFFSIYVAHYYGEGAGAVKRARELISVVRRQVAASADSAEIAHTAEDVRRITRSGKKAVLLGLEGGNALAGSPDTLAALYEQGIRYVTLTHVNNNSWAESSQSPPRWHGLNERGVEMVGAMNRLGVIVDVSHVSDSTFYDAVRISRAPVMFSHSSARALVDNVRNVNDDMLRALAKNGGVIMINFFDAMVNSNLSDSLMSEVYRRMGGRNASLNDIWSVVYELKRERGLPGASLEDVVNHIDHAVKIAGIDHVGLGSDFDGVFDLPGGLQDVTRFPWITYELMKLGYTEEDLYKILGGNALRVLEEVEQAAEQ